MPSPSDLTPEPIAAGPVPNSLTPVPTANVGRGELPAGAVRILGRGESLPAGAAEPVPVRSVGRGVPAGLPGVPLIRGGVPPEVSGAVTPAGGVGAISPSGATAGRVRLLPLMVSSFFSPSIWPSP